MKKLLNKGYLRWILSAALVGAIWLESGPLTAISIALLFLGVEIKDAAVLVVLRSHAKALGIGKDG